MVDDYAAAGTTWHGLPLVRGADLDAGAVVIHCATSISPLSAHRMLAQRGATIIGYAELCRCYPQLSLPRFVAETRADVAANPERWHDLASALADQTSRTLLDQLLTFRLSGDYTGMEGCSVCFGEQYFDAVVQVGPETVFVDCGGFDGDTSAEFIRRYPRFSRIWLFEPSQRNFASAQRRLGHLASVTLVPLGVSDRAETLCFDDVSGSASTISGAGATRIDVVPIDSYIDTPVSFIKMDLEGWEMRALAGAAQHIRNDHPTLAIAVYHHPADFWKVHRFVTGIRNDYTIYLRHYSEGWSETVMYFIPR